MHKATAVTRKVRVWIMSIVRKLHHRFLVYLVFIASLLRTVAAQVLPGGKEEPAQSSSVEKVSLGITRGVLMRLKASALGGHEHQYALEATGTFPYVRVVSLWTDPVPVPFEVAGLSRHSGERTEQPENAPVLNHKAKPAADDIFCIPLCDSCIGCGGCGSCCSCVSCIDSCVCHNCNSCGSCCSCGSCTPG